MNHLFNVNLNLFFFSTSFKTDFQFQEVNTFSPCSLLNFWVRQLRVRLLVSYAVLTKLVLGSTSTLKKHFSNAIHHYFTMMYYSPVASGGAFGNLVPPNKVRSSPD